ncbi:hypothetical protein [Filifactor alocis]|uniref:hypothetical protein n=1 Tax=Filifactor alocis TaxID=143361 RepID=UPI003FA002B3
MNTFKIKKRLVKNAVVATAGLSIILTSTMPSFAETTVSYGNWRDRYESSEAQYRNRYSNIEPNTRIHSEENNPVKIWFEMDDDLIYRANSSQTVTLRTRGIPDGAMVDLSINDRNGIWIPPQVKIMNNTATFEMYSSRYASPKSYQLTATYMGNSFHSGVGYGGKDYVDVSRDKILYIKDVIVNRNLDYGKKDEIRVTVRTQNINDGSSLRPSISGDLFVEDGIVYNNMAIIRVINNGNTKKGPHTLTIRYAGQTQRITVFVGDGSKLDAGVKSNFVRGVEQQRVLKSLTKDDVQMLVMTNGLKDGTLLDVSVPYPLKVNNSKIMVQSDQAVFTVTNEGKVPQGSYAFTIRYGTHYANGIIQVGNNKTGILPNHVDLVSPQGIADFYNGVQYYTGTFNQYGRPTDENGKPIDPSKNPVIMSQNIRDINIRPIVSSDKDTEVFGIDITTMGIDDGKELDVKLPSGFTMDGSTKVNKNQASFKVSYKKGSIPTGQYETTVKYDGQIVRFYLNVHGNSKSRESYVVNVYEEDYTINRKGYRVMNYVLRTNLPDDRKLEIDVPKGFNVDSRVRIYKGRAYFSVDAKSDVEPGIYKGYVYYDDNTNLRVPFDIIVRGERPSKVQVTGLNRYIKNVHVSSVTFNIGQKRSIDIVFDTNEIPDGTELRPRLLPSRKDRVGLKWDPRQAVRVRGNQAVFTVEQETNTMAGSYTVELIYKGQTVYVVISIV